MQHFKAIRIIPLLFSFVLISFGCSGGNRDFTYEGTDTITITKYTGAGGDVTIPAQINGKSVTGIGFHAFHDCDTLSSITIPDSVTIIVDNAFSGCDNLSSITIPDSVTSIGDHAFSGCNNLSSVNIPASVTSMGDNNYAFLNCDSLTAINVDTANTMYSSEDGILYNKAKTTLIQYPAGKTAASFTIPNTVTIVSDYAFENCDNLTVINIPASITGIGNNFSFPYYCDNITAINVDAANTAYSSEDGVLYNKTKSALIRYPIGKTAASFTIPNTVTSIVKYAFSNCVNLTGVTIPNSVTDIGFGAFVGCRKLTGVTIPNSVTGIETIAFADCVNLTAVTIPKSVTNIGDAVFTDCTGLTAINVDSANTAYISDDGILYNKAKTILVQYPAGKTAASFTIPESVISIGGGAFSGCASLSSVTIPDSVTNIGSCAFAECGKLTGVTIPNSVTSIEGNAFYGCASLTSVTIPASVTSIHASAFAYCINLESVTFEGTITSDDFGYIDPLFGIYSPFDGDLRDKYLNGGARTYTTTKSVTESSTWAMQQSILEKLIRMATRATSASPKV